MTLVQILELRNETVAHLYRFAQVLIEHDHVDHSIRVVAVLVERLLECAKSVFVFRLIDHAQRLTVEQQRRGDVLVGLFLECEISVLDFLSLLKKQKKRC